MWLKATTVNLAKTSGIDKCTGRKVWPALQTLPFPLEKHFWNRLANSFFSWDTILLETEHWQSMVIQSLESGRHILKMNNVNLSLQGNNEQYLLLIKHLSFEAKIVSIDPFYLPHENDSSPILREFYDEASGDINKYFWYWIIKYVNIWMTYINQWTSIFQMNNT